ncbi:hypothetical protein GQ55_9G233300 [Panicum hallii var. hallii]|uniref:HMA domain-containing protein n=1 Tax=Panicum hallii var. hallii TaxID=1504633 RepID=A0A2T7C6F2_9POAL|nr:hypothetical protein GQ55_9G233300 [Panicum hallii var. hallii]
MAPVILAMDVHCDSCAKKIQKAIMKVPGAESVTASCETGLVVVEGTADAAAVMARLRAKTKKAARVVSNGVQEEGEAAAAGASGSGSVNANPPPPAGAPAGPADPPAPAPPIFLEMDLHCRRGRGHDGRAGAPGGGNRDGGRLGGGDEPRGHDEEARQGRQRPPERGRRAGRVRPRAAEGGRGASGGGADHAGDVRGDCARGAAGGDGGRRRQQPLDGAAVSGASSRWAPAGTTRLSASSISTRPATAKQWHASVSARVVVVRCPSAGGRLLPLPGTTGGCLRRPTLGGARPTVGGLLYASRR